LQGGLDICGAAAGLFGLIVRGIVLRKPSQLKLPLRVAFQLLGHGLRIF
jgi:hypothetical protein